MSDKRILIVDDDSNVVRILARTFQKSGFSVQTARHGEEAYALLSNEYAFDALICDIQMPRMTGRELCQRLAETGPYLPDCVLIVTSRSENEERDWVEALPSVCLVEKPVGPKQLLRTVRQRLESTGEDPGFDQRRRAA